MIMLESYYVCVVVVEIDGRTGVFGDFLSVLNKRCSSIVYVYIHTLCGGDSSDSSILVTRRLNSQQSKPPINNLTI